MNRFFTSSLKRFTGQGVIHSKEKILFISQPLFKDEKEIDTLDYFCQMLGSICIHLDELKEYDVVVKTPSTIHIWSQQIDFIKECIDNPFEYKYIIISPYDRVKLLEHIVNLIKIKGNKTVFTIDKGYTDLEFESFFDNGVDVPIHVKADWIKGGVIAAEEFKDYIENNFEDNIISNCQILIVHGNDCHEREDSFKTLIDEYSEEDILFNASIKKINGNFLRADAKTEFTRWVKKNKTNIKKRPLLGIFSCNDEMALGVREAIKELKYNGYFQQHSPKIIGFDGIRDVVLLISEEDEYLLATVNIKVDKQVSELIGLIKDLESNIEIKQPSDIECEIYK